MSKAIETAFKMGYEAAKAAFEPNCMWIWDNDEGEWNTVCGLGISQDGCQGPEYLDWEYCPYCGKKVKEIGPVEKEGE